MLHYHNITITLLCYSTLHLRDWTAFVVYRNTSVCSFKSHWHKYGKINMSTKQGIHIVIDVKEHICLPNVKFMNCNTNVMVV